MKRMETVPGELLRMIKKQKQKRQEVKSGIESYALTWTLPVRPVYMRIQRATGNQLEETISPATDILLRPKSIIDRDHIDRDGLTYFVAGTGKAFPFGHVYRGSGHICLGSIFVPSRISRFNPQQPLETLFLHNDRNLNHGQASLPITPDMRDRIYRILDMMDVPLSEDSESALQMPELLSQDGIWLIGADVLSAKDLGTACNIMTTIYEILFEQEKRQ